MVLRASMVEKHGGNTCRPTMVLVTSSSSKLCHLTVSGFSISFHVIPDSGNWADLVINISVLRLRPNSNRPSLMDWNSCAREDLQNGIYSVEVEYHGKKPLRKGWQNLRLKESDFIEGTCDLNRGRLLGIPPPAGVSGGWVVCVDLDCPAAISLAPSILPRTGEIGGRSEKSNSHYYYESNPPPSTCRFRDLSNRSLVELLSTGSQILVPPSIYSDRQPYKWHLNEKRTYVSRDEIIKRVACLATLSLFCSCSSNEENVFKLWEQTILEIPFSQRQSADDLLPRDIFKQTSTRIFGGCDQTSSEINQFNAIRLASCWLSQ